MKRTFTAVLAAVALILCFAFTASAKTETVTLHKIDLAVDGELQANNNATTVERLEDCIKITPTPSLATANKDANLNIHSLKGTAGIPVDALRQAQYITLEYKYELGTGVTQSATNMQLVLLTNGGALSGNVTLNSNEVPVPNGKDFATVRFDLGDISAKINSSGTVNQMWLRVYGGSTKGTDIDASEIMYVGDISFMAELEIVDTVYLSENGSDANDGLTPATAVATVGAAQTIITEPEGTVFVIGTVNGVDANSAIFGVAGKKITFKGYTDGTYTATPVIKSRIWQKGDVAFENITLQNTTKGDYNAMRTNGFNLTIGKNVVIKDKDGGTSVAFSQMRETAYSTVDTTINMQSGETSYGVALGTDWITAEGLQVLNMFGDAKAKNVVIGNGNTNGTPSFNGTITVKLYGSASVDKLSVTTHNGNNRMGLKGIRSFNVSENASVGEVMISADPASGYTRTGITVLTVDGGSVGKVTSTSTGNDATARVVIFNDGIETSPVSDMGAIVLSVAKGGTAEALTTMASDYSASFDGFKITAPEGKPYVFIDGVLTNEADSIYEISSAKEGDGETVGVYEITFSGDVTVTVDGEEKAVAPGSEFTLPAVAPERAEDAEHYTFDGWICDVDDTKLYGLGESLTVNGDMTFTAKFSKKSYTVTIDGTADEFEYLETVTLPVRPTDIEDGYNFLWYDKTNDKTYAAGAVYTVSGDAIIERRAEAKDYVITIDGTDYDAKYGETITLPERPSDVSEEYSFLWYDSTNDKEYEAGAQYTVGGNAVLERRTTLKKVTVTIDGTADEYNVNDEILLGQRPTDLGEDYSFYWYDKTNGKVYEAGATYVVTGAAEIISVSEYSGAKYIPEGYYDAASGKYTVNLYIANIKANTATFGFKYDTAVMTLDSFEHSYVPFGSVENDLVVDAENGIYIDRWIASEGEGTPYVDATAERQLIGKFTFTMPDYDAFDAASDFVEAQWQDKEGAYKDGQYLAVPHRVDYDTTRIPVVIEPLCEVELKKAVISGDVILVREDGRTPNPDALARISVISASGDIVAQYTEDEALNVGTISYSLEVNPGRYTLKVEKHGYVTFTKQLEVTGDMAISAITLLPGDIKGSVNDTVGDGKVDLSDFVRVVRGFDEAASESYRRTVDINEDGAVSVTDLGFIKASFGKGYGEN